MEKNNNQLAQEKDLKKTLKFITLMNMPILIGLILLIPSILFNISFSSNPIIDKIIWLFLSNLWIVTSLISFYKTWNWFSKLEF